MPDFDPDALPLRARLAMGARQALMTAAAASIAYASTSVFGLREGYWAAISAIVVMQSDLTDTENSARDRFIGTAIGGLVGWICAVSWHGHIGIYAVAIGITIFICWSAKLSAAGRLGAVTLTVIVLIAKDEPLWKVALFRFLEVSWGIAVAIAVQIFVNWAERHRKAR
jgi:uncharacterized membrane protein YgaE (UPF0421/DUF939 family)